MNLLIGCTRPTLLVFFITFLMSGCASSNPPQHGEGELSGPERLVTGSASDVSQIILELPTGSVEVVAVPGSQVSAELEIRCDPQNAKCLKLAETVTLDKKIFENKMYIATSTRSKFAFRNARCDYRIQVPDNLPLRIVMGYGELNVKGVRDDLTIDMTAGDVDVEAALSQVRKVWVDANFGDARVTGIRTGQVGERRFLVGAEASWDEGPGKHDILVNLGAGDITVDLSAR